MKLVEILDVIKGNQFVDVYYKDKDGALVKCTSHNATDSIDDKYDEAEVLNVSVTKYNTLDILIERVLKNKRYYVTFSLPDWVSLDEDVEIEFGDDEDEDYIEQRIEDEFLDWVRDKLKDLEDDAEHRVTEIEEY